MKLSSQRFIDVTKFGSLATFFNRSCDHNERFEVWNKDGEKRSAVTVIQEIAIHEEITIDYNWWDTAIDFKCMCRTTACKKPSRWRDEHEVSDTSPTAPHWWLAVVFGFIGVSHAFPTIAAISSLEGLYGKAHRGKVLGILSASFSGGGAVFAVVYHRWFDHQVSAYFTFLAYAFFAVCLLGAIIIKPTVHPKETDLPSTQPDEVTPLQANDDITLLPLLRTARFWYLFVSVLVGVGAPLFVMNNLSFLVESNHGDMSQVSTLVLLFSLVNLLGRFVMGAVSDAFVSTIPRSRFLSGGIIFVGVTQLLFILVPVAYIVVPVVLTGFAEGCIFGLIPVLTRELFGARHFGKNQGLLAFANAVGFPLILGPLSSALYRLQLTPGTEKCFGSSCFMPMFFITATLSVIAWICAKQLH
ncbi:unnamed protein product [Aphanomyces euteiches]